MGVAQAGYTLLYMAVFRATLPANLQLAWFKWSLPVHCLPMYLRLYGLRLQLNLQYQQCA